MDFLIAFTFGNEEQISTLGLYYIYIKSTDVTGKGQILEMLEMAVSEPMLLNKALN